MIRNVNLRGFHDTKYSERYTQFCFKPNVHKMETTIDWNNRALLPLELPTAPSTRIPVHQHNVPHISFNVVRQVLSQTCTPFYQDAQHFCLDDHTAHIYPIPSTLHHDTPVPGPRPLSPPEFNAEAFRHKDLGLRLVFCQPEGIRNNTHYGIPLSSPWQVIA